MSRRALISVYRKDGLEEFAAYLVSAGWELLSTGGTARFLKDKGMAVTDVSSVTSFPECLDGRVKTLHPAIHAGLLARREDESHMRTLAQLGLDTIDLVCVNLYPFFEKVQAGLGLEETVEFIDIGGPTMLRSAAKNFRDVIVLTDPSDYDEAISGMKAGGLSLEARKRLAGKVFNLTSAYDGAVSRYLLDESFPEFWPHSLFKAQELRYGENAHQSAALYLDADRQGAIGAMKQLQGKDLSYNNIRDLDLAWKAASAFGIASKGIAPLGWDDELGRLKEAGLSAARERISACCVAVKHNTPCGVGLGPSLVDAYQAAYDCDPLSIFGGIVACTVEVDEAVAQKLTGLFLEIVVAPSFTPGALELFRTKKNLRVLEAAKAPDDRMETISVAGGLLAQSSDRKLLEKWEVVTKASPDPADLEDLFFGLRTVVYVKSNAIVVAKDKAAVGIAGGQTNRIWAARQALERSAENIAAAKKNGRGDGKPARVLASDAYFPFADVVEAAAAAGIKAIIQPGGSIRDKESIEACDRHGLAMIFTGTRHFKH